MCDGFYMAWHPHVFVEPIFFAIQNLDGAVHPSSFVFPIQFVIYILTNSDSWGKLCSSHPGPIEVVQSTKYNFGELTKLEQQHTKSAATKKHSQLLFTELHAQPSWDQNPTLEPLCKGVMHVYTKFLKPPCMCTYCTECNSQFSLFFMLPSWSGRTKLWMFSCLVRRFKDFKVRHRNEEQGHLALDCWFFRDFFLIQTEPEISICNKNVRHTHDA